MDPVTCGLAIATGAAIKGVINLFSGSSDDSSSSSDNSDYPRGNPGVSGLGGGE